MQIVRLILFASYFNVENYGKMMVSA
jgi:hypothetical protein